MLSASHKYNNQLPRWRKLTILFPLIFIILFILSFSFPHEIIPDIGKYTTAFFEIISSWFAEKVLRLSGKYSKQIVSDSTLFYVNTLVITIISFASSVIYIFLEKGRTNYIQLRRFLIIICRYYLSIQLLVYGFSKIFKAQFYLPEPNTLFTTVGHTPRDLLYWTVMGTSRAYNIFMGTTELLAACLLFFRRTTFPGSLLCFGIFLNVIAINFSFDISVKIYSCFLMFLTLVILSSYKAQLWQIISQNNYKPQPKPHSSSPRAIMIIKAIIILYIFTDALLPYARAGSFNDDNVSRPVFHGAYNVKNFKWNNILNTPDLQDSIRWKRIFIHREGYFIIEFMNEEMKDFRLNLDRENKIMKITDYDSSSIELKYIDVNNALQQLHGNIKGNSFDVELEKILLEQLPLLQNEFHWTIDEINDK